jgi:hypothetical protein
MLINLVLAEIVGFIPIIGDIFVGVYCVNSRNVFLFERYLKEKYEREYVDDDDIGCCWDCCIIWPKDAYADSDSSSSSSSSR